MAPVERIREAVSALWATPPDDGVTPRRSIAFPDLLAACGKINPRMNDGFAVLALENALRSLGAPWMRVGNVQPLAPSPTEAAHRLATSLVATQGRRRHLCPLDGADRLPAWSFGSNRVVRFSPAELDSIVGPARLLRHHQRWSFDTHAFAQVQWLVVDEDVALAPAPSVRAVPLLGSVIGEIDGRINPHAARLPTAVEEALFALLLRPWEDVVEYSEFDWRPFRVPWIYSVDDDIFASPAAPPDPTTLRWTEVALNGPDGDVVDVERPDVWPLDTKALVDWPPLDDAEWDRIRAALKSSLLARPVSHFLTRAFYAEGIDEFLAHITAIEAALALPRDHDARSRPKLTNSTSQGATHRLALRIGNLLQSEAAGDEFRALYRARSNFLHGATMQDIPAAQRLGARDLARRVSAALSLHAADNAHLNREPFLASLCP